MPFLQMDRVSMNEDNYGHWAYGFFTGKSCLAELEGYVKPYARMHARWVMSRDFLPP